MLQNRLFFALASRSGFGATISDAVARSSIVFFELSLCRSHCNGCVKVASCCGCIRNTIPWGSDHLLREWSAKLSLRMVLDPKCLLEWPSLSGRQLAQGGWQRGSISSFFRHQSTRNNSWHGASSDSFKALHLIQCTRVKSSSTWLLFQGFSGFEDMVPMATLVWLVWGCFEMQRWEVRPARCRLLMAGWFLN